MKPDSISIIIPVYNAEKYIEETLLSIINQTSSPDEIILVNDGSTDNSQLILKKFIQYPGFKIYETVNNGSSHARNYGRARTRCDYVYFLDADDLINKDLIYDLRSTIKKYDKPDIILFSGKIFSKTSLPKRLPNFQFSLSGKFTGDSNLISKLTDKKEGLPQPGRWISKNSLWINNKINFPPIICEDEAVFWPLLAFSKNTIILPKIYLHYRMGSVGSQISSKSYAKFLAVNLYMIKFIINFMNNNDTLIKKDISAWRYRLGRNGLKYVSMCVQTKTSINWRIIFSLISKMKSFNYLFKITWRIVKTKFKSKV